MLVRVHVLFDGSLPGPGSIVVQRDPAIVVSLAQDGKECGEIHTPRAEYLVEIHSVVFLLARRRTLPAIGGVVPGLAVLEVYGRNTRVVIAKALHRIDAAQGRMRSIEYHIDQLGI